MVQSLLLLRMMFILVAFLIVLLVAPSSYADNIGIRIGGIRIGVSPWGISLRTGCSQGGCASSAEAQKRQLVCDLINDGVKCGRVGESEKAYDLYLQAVKLDPENAIAWFNLAVTCGNLGRMEEGIWVGNQFLARFPFDSRRKRAQALVEKLSGELEKQRAAYAQFGPASGMDYLPLVCREGVMSRWPVEKMPIKVYLADAKRVPGFSSNWHGTAMKAFSEWSTASSKRLIFILVDSADQADIECTWISDRSEFPAGDGNELGLTQRYCDEHGVISKAKIWLLTRDKKSRAHKDTFSDTVMHGLCLHEIGHALGLAGHSDCAKDIMYFMSNASDYVTPELTMRDEQTLNRLYAAGFIADVACSAALPGANADLSVDVMPDPWSNSSQIQLSQNNQWQTLPKPYPLAYAQNPAAPVQNPVVQADVVARSNSLSAYAGAYPQYSDNRPQAAAQPPQMISPQYLTSLENSLRQEPNNLLLMSQLGSVYATMARGFSLRGDIDNAQNYFTCSIALFSRLNDPARLYMVLQEYSYFLSGQNKYVASQEVRQIWSNFAHQYGHQM